MSDKTITLVIGDFQAGKTTGTVEQALENIKNEPNTINIFIASGTNDQKRNQELTLRKELEKQNINLYQNIITGRDEIEQFSLIVRKLGKPCQEYPMISCIAHIDSLLEVKGMITDIATKFKTNFDFKVFIDESDIHAIDHEIKETRVQRTECIQSIQELRQIVKVTHITATPFSPLVANTDYDEIKFIPHKKGYISLTEITKSYTPCLTKKDIQSLHLSPTKEMKEQIEKELLKGGVTLVSTVVGNAQQTQQAQNICNIVDKDTMVALFNQGKGIKLYHKNSLGNIHTSKWDNDVEHLYDKAIKLNVKKVFIIGYLCLNRSVTLRQREGKFNHITGYIFNAHTKANREEILQRAARACGYSSTLTTLYTCNEVFGTLMSALANHDKVIQLFANRTDEMKNHITREKLLNEIKWEGNYKVKHSNGYSKASKDNKLIQVLEEEISSKIKEFYKKVIPFSELNPNIKSNLESSDEGVGRFTWFKEWVAKQFEPLQVNRVLTAYPDKERKNRIYHQQPNQIDWKENFRDTLYYIDKDKEEIRLSHQPYQQVKNIEDIRLYNPYLNIWYKMTKKGALYKDVKNSS
jgi:hypothetical protein